MWALGLLPYKPGELELVLQDVDIVTPSTESTSVLSDSSMTGQMKTRVVAAWAEKQGFKTNLYECLFDNSMVRQVHEPAVALCGLDNAIGRRAFDEAGFPMVLEAGLGSGYRNFRTLRVHTLPGARSAAQLWKGDAVADDVTNQKACRRLVDGGALYKCGVTQLAGKVVGAPYVGCTAAALVIAEVLRFLHCRCLSQLVDLDLHNPDFRAIVHQSTDLSKLNPGFVKVRA